MEFPIFQHELRNVLRNWRAWLLLLAAAVVPAALVLSRWPETATVDLSGVQAQQVFRVFAYGLLVVVVLLVPAFPAVSIVREKLRGTLALLLNSPLSPASIFWGKWCGLLAFVAVLLSMSLPAAAAAYAMGGISVTGQILPLFLVLVAVLVQYTALALFISSRAQSIDSSLRITYAAVLFLVVVTLGPHYFLRGQPGALPMAAEYLRCLSPVPAVMELAGHRDVGSFGIVENAETRARFLGLAVAATVVFATLTIRHLKSFLLDRPRPAGRVTDDRPAGQRTVRRVVFVVDPQRRKRPIPRWVNPVMAKEFRTRRFGRTHWLARLVAASAVISLLLTYAATTGTLDWGVETIGGIMVVLQVALVVIVTPSLAASLISGERESGGWDLLRMTPLSATSIVVGKLASVLLTLALVLFATLPGYLVMIWIHPPLRWQVWQVLISLAWMALFATLLSAAVSSCCRRAASATTLAYGLLGGICFGTLVMWLGHGTTFGRRVVESVLKVNPLAAALNIIEAPGFAEYQLVPANWWWMTTLSLLCGVIVVVRTWRLTRSW
ncbi:MAG: ABC transporter permease [Pirellulaceae bacterium]|jgi:ABC-type transport system involved in multi-copper enzyme maturation permease subunit|nr:ABC transporter permease [Pirellulaceae bacterium]